MPSGVSFHVSDYRFARRCKPELVTYSDGTEAENGSRANFFSFHLASTLDLPHIAICPILHSGLAV